MRLSYGLPSLVMILTPASAFIIKFENNCDFTVWPAIGKAPNGFPDPSVSFGMKLPPKKSSKDYSIDDNALGIRAWGRTGCDANGANCKTGKCVGGLVCTDGGITSGVILSEYGWGDYGEWGGPRISWNLSKVDGIINIDTVLSSSDGQSVTCTTASCVPDNSYNVDSDHQAVRNSPLGTSFTHIFCQPIVNSSEV